MARSTEVTFGAKLQRGYDLQKLIANYPLYRSARAEDSPAEFLVFLDEVQVVHKAKSKSDQAYWLAADAREKAFRTGDKPLRTLVTRISNAVKGQYGKGSKEYETIFQVASMISSSAKAKPKNSNGTPPADGAAAGNDAETEAVSRSFQSYGSLIANFEKMIASLEALPGFTPVSDELNIDSLKDFSAQLRSLNGEIVPKFEAHKKLGESRTKGFKSLKERADRIKGNVQSIYGTSSQEFKNVKGLKF